MDAPDTMSPATSAPAEQAPERGAAVVEYCLLLALIAVVTLGAVSWFGGAANAAFAEAGQRLAAVAASVP